MIDIISDRFIRWRILSGKISFYDNEQFDKKKFDNYYDNLNYKLHGIFDEILIGFIILFWGIVLNCLLEVIIISLVFNNLKLFCFKWHFGTFKKCSICSTIYLILLSEISKYTTNYRLCTFIICFALFIFTFKYVPNIPDEDKTKSNKFYIITYISIFIGLVIINLISMNIVNKYTFLVSNSVSIGIISVELFLTKTGFHIFQMIDKIKLK